MKRLLPFLLLAACNQTDPSRLVGSNGSEINMGVVRNFAAKGTVIAGFDRNGNPKLIIRNDSEAVPYKTVETAGVYGLARLPVMENIEQINSNTTLGLATTKAGVAGKAIDAKVETARIGADVINSTTIPK